MRIVIYTSNCIQSDKLTKGLMDSFSETARIEPYDSMDELKRRLMSLSEISILVLYVHNSAYLKELLDKKNLIASLKTLLILPDSEAETVSSAHQLRPNYIGYQDESGLLKNILAVIDRMILSRPK
ncbi:MAG: hypothetical protein ACOC5U_01245 [Candidatus Aminicenantaceae bacterium]